MEILYKIPDENRWITRIAELAALNYEKKLELVHHVKREAGLHPNVMEIIKSTAIVIKQGRAAREALLLQPQYANAITVARKRALLLEAPPLVPTPLETAVMRTPPLEIDSFLRDTRAFADAFKIDETGSELPEIQSIILAAVLVRSCP